MADLYVANCSNQRHDFVFRMPETGAGRIVTIQAGTQQRVLADVSTAIVDAVVKQHERYGMIPVADVPLNKDYAGLLYSVDKPILAARMVRANETNTDVLVKQGFETRKAAAVALHATMNRDGLKHRGLEMEVQEQVRAGQDEKTAFRSKVDVVDGAPVRGKGRRAA